MATPAPCLEIIEAHGDIAHVVSRAKEALAKRCDPTKRTRRWAVEVTHATQPLTRKTFVHTVDAMEIEWDPKKAEANQREHGVSFAEAATVLVDEYALSREDQDSVGEQRFVSLEMSCTGALLVVVYTHREPDIYRLVSSWKANKPQRNQYEKGRR